MAQLAKKCLFFFFTFEILYLQMEKAEREGGADLLVVRLNEQVCRPLLLRVDGDGEGGRL